MRFSLLEKFGASLLICAWLIYGSYQLGEILVPVSAAPTAEEGAPAAAQKPAAEAATQAPAAAEVDFAALLRKAEPQAGEKVFGKCKSCHSVAKGDKHKVGPNLFGVVGGDVASKEGFAYSATLTGLAGDWSYEHLNAFLTAPQQYAPGTKMSYAGLKDAADRAAVIRYLREQADTPAPLP
jgi:cytochrome c